MNTQEQAARNAEIVCRRLAGERTGDLALEYGVSATRIGQLVRRHKEKAGEVPNTSRRKKPARSIVRPRLRKVELGLWECSGEGVARRAETPNEAYSRWVAVAISNLMHAPSRKEAPVRLEPEEPYRGEVTIIPGMRPGNPLKLPTALLLNGARARAAQPYTPSLSGGRRGGE